ncbi:MAG: PQQ-binding-like beta-propeller repeat protein [Proteobacteria bacterium]|nr:PQQ-binding-like beta-propeller repeat protein [Pseudomonadota bacterium]
MCSIISPTVLRRPKVTIHILFASALLACSPSGNAKGATGVKKPVQKPKSAISDEQVKKTPTVEEPDHKKGWTTFRGSPRRTGRSFVKGPRKATLKWVFRTEGRVYADVAIASDGTLYIASHDHHLYAVSPDGREKWSYDAEGKIWTSPAVATDGTIYLGSDNDRLTALDPSGRERWIFSTAQPPEKGDKPEAGRWDVDTSPVLADDGTIIFGCHLYLYALRPNGMLRWYFQAAVGKAKIFSSPTLGHDGTIYFGTQGQYFFALNQSAKALWNIKTSGDNDSTPAVGNDGTVFFASDDGKVRAVAPGGNLKWEFDAGAPVRAPMAIGHDGTVFASTYNKSPFLIALDGKDGKEKWRYHIESGDGSFYGIQSGALIDSEGYVYFGGRDHYIYCLSPTGKLVWRYKTGNQVDSGPVLGPDGTLYVGSDDKRVYAFAPAS